MMLNSVNGSVSGGPRLSANFPFVADFKQLHFFFTSSTVLSTVLTAVSSFATSCQAFSLDAAVIEVSTSITAET
jgi:hypothetical protein